MTSQIVNPAYGNLNGRLWGECLVELCTFQNQNPVRVFLYHCISDGNQLFSENFGCHFHFILNIMSDKAAFVRELCFVYRVTRETSSSPAPTAPPAGRELICIYMRPQIV